MDDIDIRRSASLLMEEHGAEEAMKVAAKRADSFRLQGDVDGFAIWTQIILALMTLERRGADSFRDDPPRRPN